MIRYVAAFVCLLFVITACTEQSVEGVNAENAYAYPTSKVQTNGAVFMTLKNSTDQEIKVISATGDIAERIELHTHIMDGDIMMMREVDGYDIPANDEITLEPTGHHIMLMGLREQLVAGQSFPLNLKTNSGTDIAVTVTIGSGE